MPWKQVSNDSKAAIIRELDNGSDTIQDIARNTEISEKTVRKHAKDMLSKGYLSSTKKSISDGNYQYKLELTDSARNRLMADEIMLEAVPIPVLATAGFLAGYFMGGSAFPVLAAVLVASVPMVAVNLYRSAKRVDMFVSEVFVVPDEDASDGEGERGPDESSTAYDVPDGWEL